ncbi:uncharacterized protein B0H18DRAFT_1216442 [Fomitopsis serialis]|uniref:uncharacterized protein n=1 Tax=Fomitopsis serialis TaxID=139415 RepID=UPI002007CC07|nr:uncharacterized protein B0H18DRAFT_1216442 [Neoantrodia serialis]KAH9913378.1 hypothetical protein B0H18DRAFT_1216442 [Neoantrodia serialis]
MLSQGVGEKVTKICIELVLYFNGLDDFLSYEPYEGPAPPLDLASVRSGLQNVTAVELVIQMVLDRSPTPVTDAATRIISPLFAHWDARGMLSVINGGRRSDHEHEGKI